MLHIWDNLLLKSQVLNGFPFPCCAGVFSKRPHAHRTGKSTFLSSVVISEKSSCVLCLVVWRSMLPAFKKTKGKQGLKYDMLHLTMEAFTTQCYAKVLLVCWQMILRFVGKCSQRVRCTTEAGWLIKEAIQRKQPSKQRIQVDMWALKLKVFIKNPSVTYIL